MPRDLQPEGHGRRNFSKCHLFCASPLHYRHERRLISCSDHLVREKSQSQKNVVKKNRCRDHHHLQPFKLGASGLQRFCLGWSWKLISWKRPLWLLHRLLLCLRNGKEKPEEMESRPKDLGFASSPFSTPCNNSRVGARFRVQIKVNAWVVEKYHLFCSRF